MKGFPWQEISSYVLAGRKRSAKKSDEHIVHQHTRAIAVVRASGLAGRGATPTNSCVSLDVSGPDAQDGQRGRAGGGRQGGDGVVVVRHSPQATRPAREGKIKPVANQIDQRLQAESQPRITQMARMADRPPCICEIRG